MRRPQALVALVFLCLPSVALAQTKGAPSRQPPSRTDAPAAPSASEPRDVVRLHDGSFFRGTLMVHDIAGQTTLHVEGRPKTFPSADVRYAGPASFDPGPVAPRAGTEKSAAGPLKAPATTETAAGPEEPKGEAPPVDRPSSESPTVSPGAMVKLVSNRAGMHFYLVDPARAGDPPALRAPTDVAPAYGGSSNRWYWPLCRSPCEAPIVPGSYQIATSNGVAEPSPIAGNVVVAPGTTVTVKQRSRAGIRWVGALLAVGSAVTSVIAAERLERGSGGDGSRATLLGGGLGVVLGSVMMLIPDPTTASSNARAIGPVSPQTTSGARVFGAGWSGRF
jgi:hypothetical protein